MSERAIALTLFTIKKIGVFSYSQRVCGAGFFVSLQLIELINS